MVPIALLRDSPVSLAATPGKGEAGNGNTGDHVVPGSCSYQAATESQRDGTLGRKGQAGTGVTLVMRANWGTMRSYIPNHFV